MHKLKCRLCGHCFVTLRQKFLLCGRKAARFFSICKKISRNSNNAALGRQVLKILALRQSGGAFFPWSAKNFCANPPFPPLNTGS
jgi:hypothetical protein